MLGEVAGDKPTGPTAYGPYGVRSDNIYCINYHTQSKTIQYNTRIIPEQYKKLTVFVHVFEYTKKHAKGNMLMKTLVFYDLRACGQVCGRAGL